MIYAAGIVLYNPEPERLKENINAIINQCEHLFLVDNGSTDIEQIMAVLAHFASNKISLIPNEKNEGIAKALNQLCSAAKGTGFTWLLTLDQDSVCPPNMIEEYSKYVSDNTYGMLCPLVKDRNIGEPSPAIEEPATKEIAECITSGSLIRLSVWEEAGKFDEFMFIDNVDFDICHRIRYIGYKIVRINSIILLHELGHLEYHRFLFWKVLVKNHSAFRKYYISRNTIYLARKEHRSITRALLQNAMLLLINWGYEKDKWNKTKQIFKGTKDGLKCEIIHAKNNK